MAAGIPRPPSVENVSSSLSAGITDVATTITIGDASNIVAPCYLVVDRVDSAGTLKTSSLWEYVKVTNVAGNDLTVTRAQNGSTAQSHSAGAIIEAVVTSAHFEDWYTVLNPEHDAAGGHVIVGTMTVAGMNLASTATIGWMSSGNLNAVSLASVRSLHVIQHVNVSGASLSGLGFFPTFVMPNNASAATVSIGKPLASPRAGGVQWVSVTLRAPVSSASVVWDVNKNFASIFDVGTRPSILGGGTYVSTASIATKAVNAGNTLSVDLAAGGSFADATLTLGIY
jgi:hypothetical protein